MEKQNTNYETNPYIHARREWTERYGDYIMQARNWRLAAASSLMVAIILVISLAISVTQNKVIPYIVEIDKLGKVSASSPAEQFKHLDAKIIKAALANFIEDTRAITTDRIIQKRALEKVYAFLPRGSSAATFIQEYINNNNPFTLAESKTVSVQVSVVLPLSDKSWQVEWQETARDLKGSLINIKKWKAVLAIDFNPPTSEEAILTNPLGLFVTQLNWSQQL